MKLQDYNKEVLSVLYEYLDVPLVWGTCERIQNILTRSGGIEESGNVVTERLRLPIGNLLLKNVDFSGGNLPAHLTVDTLKLSYALEVHSLHTTDLDALLDKFAEGPNSLMIKPNAFLKLDNVNTHLYSEGLIAPKITKYVFHFSLYVHKSGFKNDNDSDK